jgi:hypothetical protein
MRRHGLDFHLGCILLVPLFIGSYILMVAGCQTPQTARGTRLASPPTQVKRGPWDDKPARRVNSAGAAAPASPKAAKYHAKATQAVWSWAAERASLRYCITKHLSDYQAATDATGASADDPSARGLTLFIRDHGKDVYSFGCHGRTVFTRKGDILFVADFFPYISGCQVVAVNFKTGEVLWKTYLQGSSCPAHSMYQNQVTIDHDAEAVIVHGNESYSRYIEYLDIETGETIGHKEFKN